MPRSKSKKSLASSGPEIISLIGTDTLNNTEQTQSPSNTTPTAKPFLSTLQREKSQDVVSAIINEEESKYYLCSFEGLQKKKLTSQVYDHYFALCHLHTKTSAGWAVCEYTLSGACHISKGCHKWEPEFGTTNLNRNIKSHETERGQQKYPRKIGDKAQERIIEAASMVAVRDLRPYSFAEGTGMKALLKTAFKEGQDVVPGDNIDHEDFVASARAVRDNIGVIATEFRKKFGRGIKGLLDTGGGMTIDGVTMKVQEKHFYDLTLHYITFNSKNVFETHDQ